MRFFSGRDRNSGYKLTIFGSVLSIIFKSPAPSLQATPPRFFLYTFFSQTFILEQHKHTTYYSTMLVNNNIPSKPRGSFIVLEGVDRCGKTTQTGLLMKRFLAAGIAACTMRFPDRSTATGKIIDSYLKESSTISDQAIHLLFSANRWEAVSTLTSHLNQGTTVICDRYAYSGVAFSSAKVDANGKSILSREWCQSPDVGLPAPDCVLFLDLTQEQAEKRGG